MSTIETNLNIFSSNTTSIIDITNGSDGDNNDDYDNDNSNGNYCNESDWFTGEDDDNNDGNHGGNIDNGN